ncbi:MAG TPA: hypothetical protein H9821_03755 [Candidatus Rothia avicola]|uniref:Uncharacterized protein n=1 Tax=Candidatus Rothia avicola TaxID=2840478 RepID=A0A9D1ZRE9_9MICC|nr:hypothetical protein [Candidatus Rothia avicola]
MSYKGDYFEFSKVYQYCIEVPFEGAVAEGVYGAKILEGEVAWSADIEWDSEQQGYRVSTFWQDYGVNFSDFGEGPEEDQFQSDLDDFISECGINFDNLV